MKKWKKEKRNIHGSKIDYYDKMTVDYYKRKGELSEEGSKKQKSLWKNDIQLGFKSEGRKNIDL
jgi:hypothetical protein